MTDKPTIFNAPTVRALLDGRKTQTRLVLKPQPYGDSFDPAARGGSTEYVSSAFGDYGKLPASPGDRLWVREALRMGFDDGLPISQATYAADSAPLDLTLVVTDVRVQRVQEISEADARAEGAPPDRYGGGMAGMYSPLGVDPHAYARGFRTLWNSIHGPGAWDRNDWVAAVSFEVIRANIDEVTP